MTAVLCISQSPQPFKFELANFMVWKLHNLFLTMEQCEKEIITRNMDKLITYTSCNTLLLAMLQASEGFSDADINDLKVHSSNAMEQATQFYKLIQTKAGGYQMLLKVLKETKQTGALSILNKIPSQYDLSFHYDDDDATARLGKGKFGTVFKGEWKNRTVAVKRIIHTDETEKSRIENEVEILKTCDKQSNIVRYFDIKNFEYFDLIILELCDITLKQWVADKKNVPIPRRKIMKKVTSGLEWLHKKRILYLNLKPENVLLNADPSSVKLTGLGASVQLKNGEDACQVPLPEIDDTCGFEAPETRRKNRECTFAADVYSLGSLFLFVLTDGQSNLNDLESLGNLEDTTNETNEVNKCVNDIRTIKRMTTDDPKSRPDTSELLTFAMLDQQWDENGLQETDAFSHTAEPLLLRFIQQIKHGNEGRNRGHSSAKSKQPSTGKTLEEEYKHKIEQIYQFLENVKQLDLEQLRQHGRLEKLKYADLCSFAQLTETAAANQILKHDESKVLHSMQNDLQAATDVDLNNRESCNSCCERESHDHESSVTPFVSNVLPCVHAEQMEKVNQFMKELMELRKQKAKISFGLFELVKSAEFYIIDHVLNTFAAPLIIEIFDDNKLSLLHMAVKYHSFNVVENLVNGRGFANVLHEPRFQKTLIHHCIEDIHTVDEDTFEQKRMMLEFLFAKDPLLIQSENNIKHTPLHIATDRVFSNGKQIDFIKMLLDAKACVNAKDEHGRTPLHLAVKDKVSENVNDILQILVDHGADPDAQDIINETFLHNAAKFVPPPAFHKIVNYLVSIEKTRSFHTPDKNGWTVLHHAASNMNGHPLDETLQLFKTHGVDFNALSNDGNSVMFRAIEFRRSEAFLRTLNQLGADWKLENHSRDTALHIAAHSDYLTAVKLLIGLGFDANQKNFDGNTPLHRAIDCCYFNYYNDTELKPSYDVVHELVINGADPNLKNNKGQSTVDIANDKFKEKKIGQDILNVLVNTHSIKTNF